MANEVKPANRCTQEELYSMSELMVDNAEQDLATLVVLKSKYTASYIDGQREKIVACRALPGEEIRTYNYVQIGFELEATGKVCTDGWQNLKRYIDEWKKTPEERTAAYNAAGHAKYKKAINDNWEELSGMNNLMNAFIAAHADDLKTVGFMPDAFIILMAEASSTFDNVYDLFKVARETTTATNAKVTAGNALYAEIGMLGDDGRYVFRADEGRKKRYTISALLTIISPPGAASLSVKLKRAGSFTPIVGANIRIQREGSEATGATTDAQGDTDFLSIDAGVYTITVSIASEPDRVYTKEVNTGTKARLELVIP